MIPRPPILLTLAYWAGLATGLVRFGTPLGTLAVLGGIALSGRPGALLVTAAAGAGRLAGEIARTAESGRCAALLPAGPLRLRVRVLEPVDREGARIAVRPLRAGCAGEIVARWPRGNPVTAGTEAAVTGTWLPRPGFGGRPGGTLVLREIGELAASPGPADRLRTAVYEASRRMYGARAGMVDALILGRRGGIEPELQDRFAWSGLVHLLSISGFHVGLITGWVFLAGRLARLNRPTALALAAAVSVAYVVFLGWPAPAGRAAALAVLAAHSRVLGPHVIWRTLGSSVGATLATAPITVVFLGSVAPVGVLVNFAAIPLAAVAVPGVLASLLLDPVAGPVANAMAGGAGLALHGLELAAMAGAAVPYGHAVLEPGDGGAGLLWLVGLGAGLWAIGTGNTLAESGRRVAWLATGMLWVALVRAALAAAADGGQGLALHFLDVGQGDAAAIRTPGGRWVLVDAGPASARADAGRRVVVPFLKRRGVRRLAAVIVSHAHADHLGGVPAVLRSLPAALVVEPAAPVGDGAYLAFLDQLAGSGTGWHPGRRGECFVLDGVEFTILHPEPGWSRWGEDVNEDSLVLLVEYGRFQALFAGDAGFPAEEALHGRLRPVDLLKVGHHGSRGSTGAAWLERLAPRVAVVSVGRNDYGHPAPTTLERLERRRIAVRRTDHDGTVTVTTDGAGMLVRSAHGTERFDVADSFLPPEPPHPAGASCRLP